MIDVEWKHCSQALYLAFNLLSPSFVKVGVTYFNVCRAEHTLVQLGGYNTNIIQFESRVQVFSEIHSPSAAFKIHISDP